MLSAPTFEHPLRRVLSRGWSRPGWHAAGALAVLFSTVAWASLPRSAELQGRSQAEWQALGTPLVQAAYEPTAAIEVQPAVLPDGPVRIQGRAGDSLYWALRTAGASPQATAEYLTALATQIDVGEIGPADMFDLVLGDDRQVLYAGIARFNERELQLVKWRSKGSSEWIDAANADQPRASSNGLLMPAAGRITSMYGNRRHPILGFVRFHAGLDIGAGWGSPIVAAADGQVVGAGWAGGYGRQVQIAHGSGYVTSYSHMSQIAAAPGTTVRAGEIIGYVGSSGFSTGPHLHFEVRVGGAAVDPLGVRLTSARPIDRHLAAAVKARLKTLLAVAAKQA